MESVKKDISISKIFGGYIISFCITSILLVAVLVFATILSMKYGLVLPANTDEKYINKHIEEIRNTQRLETTLPLTTKYVLFDVRGNVLEKNMKDVDSEEIWSIYKEEKRTDGVFHYSFIKRKEGICAIAYELKPRYGIEFLNTFLPYSEYLVIVVFGILFIVQVFIYSRYFKRKMEKEMEVLKETTSNINMENLDFNIRYSNVSEINDVLKAISKMKDDLHQSLKKQWYAEELKKDQMAALAHDIKTPLTIIKGNAQLLNEFKLKDEQHDFMENILLEVENVEYYIKCLIDMTKGSNEKDLNLEEVDLKVFCDDISKKIKAIATKRKFKITMNVTADEESVNIDRDKIIRVINNIVSNAVEYTNDEGKIEVIIDSLNDNIRIIIQDDGKGFTKEELICATQQFYQGEKSRNKKNHYGMGLYIVKELINQMQGKVELKKSKELGGAMVVVYIPKKL